MAQIVEPIVLGQPDVMTLDIRPEIAGVLRSMRDDPAGGLEPELMPQQRTQIGSNRHITQASAGLGRSDEDLLAAALALAPDAKQSGSKVNVSPLQAGYLSPTQSGIESQGDGELLADIRQGELQIGSGEHFPLFLVMLWFIQGIDGRPGNMAGSAGSTHDGMDQGVNGLRLSGAAAIRGETQAALDVFRSDGSQIHGSEHRIEILVILTVVLLPGARSELGLVHGHVLGIPITIKHCITSHDDFPIPIMATKYTIVPAAEYPFDRVDALSRYCFGLIFDRWKLSARAETWHKWVDDVGIYCVYDQKELGKELGVTLPTVRRCLDQLEAEKLIRRERTEKRGACRYYPTIRAVQGFDKPDGYVEYVREKYSTSA